jgi:hypothetical protein
MEMRKMVVGRRRKAGICRDATKNQYWRRQGPYIRERTAYPLQHRKIVNREDAKSQSFLDRIGPMNRICRMLALRLCAFAVQKLLSNKGWMTIRP